MVRTEVATGSSEQLESYSEVTKVPFSNAESPENVEAYGHWPDYDMFGYDVVVFMDARFNRIAQLKLAMYLRNIKTSSLVLRPTRK